MYKKCTFYLALCSLESRGGCGDRPSFRPSFVSSDLCSLYIDWPSTTVESATMGLFGSNVVDPVKSVLVSAHLMLEDG